MALVDSVSSNMTNALLQKAQTNCLILDATILPIRHTFHIGQ
ncbi:hypothetical protein [Prevotella sp. KH2C16]|nr:hypothetical protein [Prevotella sp. KH2C16]